ncbi:hypothetical protein FA13DRAFT_1715765 [Coprinellus micaceus]|uniref:Uncharacterized protein n=1 Tax=Coprinellus micaceus TaxID=71717 RepID=A0A4Y7SLT0_COPMI|nr:hypothetical protein FA13DRAFT_1715765 [Coprinellus micaceus]
MDAKRDISVWSGTQPLQLEVGAAMPHFSDELQVSTLGVTGPDQGVMSLGYIPRYLQRAWGRRRDSDQYSRNFSEKNHQVEGVDGGTWRERTMRAVEGLPKRVPAQADVGIWAKERNEQEGKMRGIEMTKNGRERKGRCKENGRVKPGEGRKGQRGTHIKWEWRRRYVERDNGEAQRKLNESSRKTAPDATKDASSWACASEEGGRGAGKPKRM